jgi:hypothetical protein
MSQLEKPLEKQSIPEPQDKQITAREPLPTLWEAPDALWEKLFLPLINKLDPPSHMGRPRADQRRCFDGRREPSLYPSPLRD